MVRVGRMVRLLGILVLLTGAMAVGGFYKMLTWASDKVTVPTETVIELRPGTSLGALAHQLAGSGIVSSQGFFNYWVRLEGNYHRYQAGTYRFSGELTPTDVAAAFIKGDIYSPVVLQITIPEGFRMRDVIDRLAANGVGQARAITALCKDPSFLHSLNIKSSSIEGYLYPATYSFHKLPTPPQALELMVKTFWQHLPKDYEAQVEALGLSLAQAVTFASLIELETRTDEERPLISEVIWRRLKDKVPLGIDAALIYGIADYQGDLTWANLADAKNPYNTRIHVGLPPTPIGAPGVKSLAAVLTPSNFGYYYYVLIAGETRHHFSKTLAEHNLHVKKLVHGAKRDKPSKGKP